MSSMLLPVPFRHYFVCTTWTVYICFIVRCLNKDTTNDCNVLQHVYKEEMLQRDKNWCSRFSEKVWQK